MFPSSIAVYGLPSVEAKHRAGRVAEEPSGTPRSRCTGATSSTASIWAVTISTHYRQLASDAERGGVDFRCIRFPGLISAVTVPSGGTSDYAPEMLHAAAQKKPYACFVREDVRIPFMAMPDGIEALLALERGAA